MNPIKICNIFFLIIALANVYPVNKIIAQDSSSFVWPKGIKAAISLSFDDARFTQVDSGIKILDQYGVKATFFVVPSTAKHRLDGWKNAVKSGHEIGNHSGIHPCSGNFPWARHKALEDYTIDKMRDELVGANNEIQDLLGVRPTVFAYPCGQTFVGRGANTRSYVPVVAELFLVGRGWLNEGPNDPSFCDFAQITGMEMDGKDFGHILPVIENAKQSGLWIVFAGHEMAGNGFQTTRIEMLRKLIEYAKDPKNEIWIAPVGTVAKYVVDNR